MLWWVDTVLCVITKWSTTERKYAKRKEKSGTSPSIAILLEGGKKKECLSNQIFVNCVTVTEFIFTILGPTKWNKKERKKGGHTLHSITEGKPKETRYLLPPRPPRRAGLSFLAQRIFFSSYSRGKANLPKFTS